jgi:GNAT superfamily N-acetyltransferase
MTSDKPLLRPMSAADRSAVSELIYLSTNSWYQTHGCAPVFAGGPQTTEIFFDVYNELEPGCGVVAEDPQSGRLMGSCFYHPRKHHVSLGIMNVHPDYFRRGVARALLQYIIDFTDSRRYKSLRLTQSAFNLDSFSLYTRAGFVPRVPYQDILIEVPVGGLTGSVPDLDRVRPATIDDITHMAELEFEVSGLTREQDYCYAVENRRGFWRTFVYENGKGHLDGWLISCGHPAFNMLGPGISRSEGEMAALLCTQLNEYKGRSPIAVVPMDKTGLVRQLYNWGGRNCELHLYQVRGEFTPFRGISMPTFLPETG